MYTRLLRYCVFIYYCITMYLHITRVKMHIRKFGAKSKDYFYKSKSLKSNMKKLKLEESKRKKLILGNYCFWVHFAAGGGGGGVKMHFRKFESKGDWCKSASLKSKRKHLKLKGLSAKCINFTIVALDPLLCDGEDGPQGLRIWALRSDAEVVLRRRMWPEWCGGDSDLTTKKRLGADDMRHHELQKIELWFGW